MRQNRRSKILIVDDVPESALITKSLLAKGNFTDVEIACGGYEALEKCGVTVDGQGEAEGTWPPHSDGPKDLLVGAA